MEGLLTSVSITWYNMSHFHKKIKDVPKGEEKQSGKAKQATESDSDMTRMLEWPHSESKITMINMSVTLMEK